MTPEQSKQEMNKQESIAIEMEGYTSDSRIQFLNYEELDPRTNMKEAAIFYTALNEKRNAYVGSMNTFSKLISNFPSELEEPAISILRRCNDSLEVIDEIRTNLRERLETLQDIYQKLIGTWHCSNMADVTYTYRADFTYDYKNHQSGEEQKSYFSLQYNTDSPSKYEIQRAGSTAYWFEFKSNDDLMLRLGEGDNAMWFAFTRQ